MKITIEKKDYILQPLTMGLWRNIEKLEIDIMAIKEKQKKTLDKIELINDDRFFDMLTQQFEKNVLSDTAEIENRRKKIVNRAFGSDEIKTEIITIYQILKNEIMLLLDAKSREMPEQKNQKANDENLTSYQKIIQLYAVLHKEYRWTRAVIDAEEIEYIYDLTIVSALGNNKEKLDPIESVL